MNFFVVDRNRPPGTYRLSDIFNGLNGSPAMIELMEDEAERIRVLNETVVELVDSEGYMYVSQDDGRLVVGSRYLKEASEQFLYLDIIHELVHIKQFQKGMDLYDSKYSYVDRPTEVEAYKLAVKEAKRLRMSDAEIADYLLVDWITRKERDRLARRLGVKVESRGRRKPQL
jgi:hypothetical protein